MKTKETKALFKGWADLVDLGFEFYIANAQAKYKRKRALKALNEVMARQNETHWKELAAIARRLK